MELTFLGTGSMVPTVDRNHSAIFLSYKDQGLLFDCGEGTQRQFRIAKMKPTKITKILITHWHGDHVLGLPGLLQTLAASGYHATLEIYGPRGSKEFFKTMMSSFLVESKVHVVVKDIDKGTVCETENFIVEALPTRHSVPGLAYAFIEKDKRKIDLEYLKQFGLRKDKILKKLQQNKDIEWKGKKIKASKATKLEKGKKICYITDTVSFSGLHKFAKASDVLVCEATLEASLQKHAVKCHHMTSEQAAKIAKKAKVKVLALTHFSQRYKSVKKLEDEAKEIFKDTICAKDFMKLEL